MSLRVGSGLPNIQKSNLENIKITIPVDVAEQHGIGAMLLDFTNEITELNSKLSQLKLQKKYLLQNLITGTIRTPEDLKPLDTSRLERSAL